MKQQGDEIPCTSTLVQAFVKMMYCSTSKKLDCTYLLLYRSISVDQFFVDGLSYIEVVWAYRKNCQCLPRPQTLKFKAAAFIRGLHVTQSAQVYYIMLEALVQVDMATQFVQGLPCLRG